MPAVTSVTADKASPVTDFTAIPEAVTNSPPIVPTAYPVVAAAPLAASTEALSAASSAPTVPLTTVLLATLAVPFAVKAVPLSATVVVPPTCWIIGSDLHKISAAGVCGESSLSWRRPSR